MSIKLITRLGLASVLALALPLLRADDAKLVKKTGSVTMTKDGQTTELNVGDAIPQGAVLKTGPSADIYIETGSGIITTLKADTEISVDELAITKSSAGVVQKQSVLLDLKKGNLVFTIDPAKRAINDYKVKTAKGVAAARGTMGAVSISNQSQAPSIASLADTITFTPLPFPGNPTPPPFLIPAGSGLSQFGAMNFPAPQPLDRLVGSNPSMGSMLQGAVNTISSVVSSNLGGMSAASATNLATQTVASASAGNPAQATNFATQVTQAVTSPGASTSSTATQTSAGIAVAATTAAPSQAASIAAAVTTVVTSTQTGASATQSAAIIASAVTTAAPSQASAIASSVSVAAPGSSGLVTAAVAVASGSSTQTIATAVATATGTSTASVQASADAQAGAGAQASQMGIQASAAPIAAAASATVPAATAPADTTNTSTTPAAQNTPQTQTTPANNNPPPTQTTPPVDPSQTTPVSGT